MNPSGQTAGTLAAAQPLPDTWPYGLYELYNYKIFSRASAKAAGLPASCYPKFNPALPIKNWVALDVDDTDINEFLTIRTVPKGDTSQIVLPIKFVHFQTQPGQAGTLNLPDEAASYPPYVVEPTTAYENSNGDTLLINPEYLSTMDQAKQMASELGVPEAIIMEWQPEPGSAGYRIIYPATESRRWYQFTDGFGQTQTVGVMVRAMNMWGVGAPGAWVNDGKVWQWLPTHVAPSDPPHGPVFPVPMRALLAGESIVGDLSMGLMVKNTNLPFGG